MPSKTLVQVLKLVVGECPEGYITYNVHLKVEGDEEYTYVVGGYPGLEKSLAAFFKCTGADNSEEIVGRLLYAMVSTDPKKVYSIQPLFDSTGYIFHVESSLEQATEAPATLDLLIEEDQVCPMRSPVKQSASHSLEFYDD